MSLGTDLAATAFDIFAEFGRSVVYTQVVNGEYDPSTSTFAQTTNVLNIKAIIEEARDVGKDMNLAAVSNRKMTTSAAVFSVEPTLSDTVKIGAATYVIYDIDTVTVGDDSVVYVFQLKKG